MSLTIDKPRDVASALAVAVEVLPGSLRNWLAKDHREALREFLLNWIMEFAEARGVIFEKKDVDGEVNAFIASIERQHTR